MWKQELIFIKRDENGVIIGVSEHTPEDYREPVKEQQAALPYRRHYESNHNQRE